MKKMTLKKEVRVIIDPLVMTLMINFMNGQRELSTEMVVFQSLKKDIVALEIVTQLRDKKFLYLIKQKFGGAVKLVSGNNHLRYRLHNKEGLLNLINKVNGLIRNPIRILQLGRICEIYDIELKDPKSLTYYSG